MADRRSAGFLVAALTAAALAAATLWPGRAVEVVPLPAGHEPLQLADLIRNAIAYLPLGAALAWSRVPALRALLLASALSAALELCQLVVPGRNPSVLDWVFNTAGTAGGIALYRTAPAWLRPGAASAQRLAIAASAVVIALFAATGILLAPAPTLATFYGHRTPDLSHLAHYAGSVLDASIDGIAIPVGRIDASDALRARLLGSYALRVDARAGPAPEALAALVLVTDEDRTEILLLGPDRDDLVFRFRSRSQPIGLESARFRLPGALRGVVPGAPLALRVERAGADLCIERDGVRECRLGFTLGDGWQLLMPDFRILAPLRPILGASWIAGLFLPLGYFARRSGPGLAACAAASTSLFALPAATNLLATPLSQLAGAVLGAAFGLAVRRHVEARLPVARGAVV